MNMSEYAKRFKKNPLVTPAMLKPSAPGLEVTCTFNPGAFVFEEKIWLLARVAERPVQKPGKVSFPIREKGELTIVEFDRSDPLLDCHDPREIKYDGIGYLTTLSHLRLLCSDDGVAFKDAGLPPLLGEGRNETLGIEDCRVSMLNDGRFVLTYSAVCNDGYGIGMRVTRDWKTFEHYGMVISPSNKDCALFEEQIDGQYMCIHRPSGVIVGGHYMWLGTSPNLKHWGEHVCIAQSRPGKWDSARIGIGASPIKTEAGWLVLYHGANEKNRYCVGAMLLDLKDPRRVIARTDEPLMEPTALYEREGFFGNVVFSNGHVVQGDTVLFYYGAADNVIAGARFSIREILGVLTR